MDHVGIDLGSKESQVCIRNSAGEILEELRVSTRRLGKVLEGRSCCRVVLETCTEAFRVADVALSHGHEVRVVPATLVRSLGVGQRGLKNDVRDARALSEASCRIELPSVHVPSRTSRELKALQANGPVLELLGEGPPLPCLLLLPLRFHLTPRTVVASLGVHETGSSSECRGRAIP